MKLLLDEMLPAEIAVQLRVRGHDVVAVTERPDLRGAPDLEVFARAQSERRALVTYDSDYLPIHARHQQLGGGQHGLIMLSRRRFPQSAPQTLGRIVSDLDALLHAGPPYAGFVHWLG